MDKPSVLALLQTEVDSSPPVELSICTPKSPSLRCMRTTGFALQCGNKPTTPAVCRHMHGTACTKVEVGAWESRGDTFSRVPFMILTYVIAASRLIDWPASVRCGLHVSRRSLVLSKRCDQESEKVPKMVASQTSGATSPMLWNIEKDDEY
jgi:hypothetical protein